MASVPSFCVWLMLVSIGLSYHLCLKDLWVSPSGIISMRCCADEGEWIVFNRSGEAFQVKKLVHFSCFKYLLVIKLIDAQDIQHWVFIPSDAVETSDFRRLNVLLQHHYPVLRRASKRLSEL